MTTLNIYLAGSLVNAIYLCYHRHQLSEIINDRFGEKATALWQLKAIAIIAITSNLAMSWSIWLLTIIDLIFSKYNKKTLDFLQKHLYLCQVK